MGGGNCEPHYDRGRCEGAGAVRLLLPRLAVLLPRLALLRRELLRAGSRLLLPGLAVLRQVT